jgi:hypothetical protein
MKYSLDCASVLIAGSGTSTLDNLPDMYVGEMTLTGHIRAGECRSTAGYALVYPYPGEANTIVEVPSIGFKKPTGGNCFTKATLNKSNTSTISSSSATTPTRGNVNKDNEYISSDIRATDGSSYAMRYMKLYFELLHCIFYKYLGGTTSLPSTTSRVLSTPRVLTPAVTTTMPMPTILPPTGDLPSQCFTYMLITDKTRHSSHPGYIGCDNAIFKKLPIWVRFSGGAGTRLVRGPAEPFRCGTQGAGWYSGSYPSTAGANISGTVCYSWPGNSCQWSNVISITNCNSYFVFALRAPPACFLRYCTS